MVEKAFTLLNSGMSRDESISKVGNTSAYENKNVRLVASDTGTMLSVTNERGTKTATLSSSIVGNIIGWVVLNDTLVLFTTGETNFGKIYKLDYNASVSYDFVVTDLLGTAVDNIDLDFSESYPIEAIAYYETDSIQKVYWIDGKHPLRLINIAASAAERATWKSDTFDSVKSIKFGVSCDINKTYDGSTRNNGTIQYFLTYYNRHMQESGFALVSDIVYLAPETGDKSADGTNNVSVNLHFSNLDKDNYQSFRVYSIFRSSYNGTAVANLVSDLEIPQTGEITIVDDAAHLTAVDAQQLLYVGSRAVIPHTMADKDNVLFLGNLSSDDKELYSAIKTKLWEYFGASSSTGMLPSSSAKLDFALSSVATDTDLPASKAEVGLYPYVSQLGYSSSKILTFKGGEKYRFALKCILGNGTSLGAIWIGDLVNPLYPKTDSYGVHRVIVECNLDSDGLGTLVSFLQEKGVASVQLMIAEATYADRSVKAQGFVNPTLFNVWERYNDRTYAIPSWISRPRRGMQHFDALRKSTYSDGEIECNYWPEGEFHTPYYKYNTLYPKSAEAYDYAVGTIGIYANLGRYTVYAGVRFIRLDSGVSNLNSYEFTYVPGDQHISYGFTIETKLNGEIGYISGGTLNDKKEQLYAIVKDSLNSVGILDCPQKATTDDWLDYFNTHSTVDTGYFNILLTTKFDNQIQALNGAASGIGENRFISGGTISTNDAYYPAYYTKNITFLDENLVTLDSPEIAYEAVNVDAPDYKFRIVGVAYFSSVISDYIIDAGLGTYKGTNVLDRDFSAYTGFLNGIKSWPLWRDFSLEEKPASATVKVPERTTSDYNLTGRLVNYWIHMWQSNESITGYTDGDFSSSSSNNVTITEEYKSSIKRKTFANLNFANSTYYATSAYENNSWNTRIYQFDSVNNSLLSLEIGDDIRYYEGNVKTVLEMPAGAKYPKLYSASDMPTNSSIVSNTAFLYSDAPVLVSYTSNRHAIVSLGTTNASSVQTQYILPEITFSGMSARADFSSSSEYVLPWKSTLSAYATSHASIWGSDTNIPKKNQRYLFIAEIYKDFSSNDTRYGGISDAAVANNRFIPASDIIDLYSDDTISFLATRGDTYFQRWDCLRTTPYSDSSMNNIIDITSVMLETHINVDSTIDRNKLLKHLAALNYTKIQNPNLAYSQLDNLFIERDLGSDSSESSYPTHITWSLEKHSGEDVDTWAHVTLTNSLALDGNKGYCNALHRFNNGLYAFQDRGIAEVMFNSRVQLSTNDGVPVELANSGKVDGKRYITDKYGCTNKWSIVEGKQGLYFVDDINRAFCLFNGSNVEDVSLKKGFKAWFASHHNKIGYAYYDRILNDIYLTIKGLTGYPTLAYNETLGSFSSFYDYTGVKMMTNINNRFISATDVGHLWFNHEGLYCNFFGVQSDYYMHYRVAPEPLQDKIWSNIDYRADVYEVLESNGSVKSSIGEGNLITGSSLTITTDYKETETFDTMKIWNEYQYATVNSDTYKPVNPVKRFRIWRYVIPRAEKTNTTNLFGLDRIRNPWVNIRFDKKLSAMQVPTNKDLMQIHDITVKYFE